MKKPSLVVLICMAWYYHLQAQPTFQRLYLSGGASKMNMAEMPSHNLFVGLAWGPGISLLAPGGHIIYTDHYWSDSILVQQSIRQSSVNEFYFVTGYQQDSCSASGSLTIPYTCPLIAKMDSLGTISAFHYYRLNTGKCWTLASDLEITADKDVITWGGGGIGSQWSFFALRTDSLANVVWAKHFDPHGSFQFIKELPSGDLLAGINMDTAGAVIARLDANGNFLWCKSYIRPKGMVRDAVILSDSTFVITGYTDSLASTNGFEPVPLDYHPILFMLKLNGAGDVLWCKGYDSPPNLWYARRGLRVVRSQDGNQVVLANLGSPGYNLWYRPFLMKTDQNGDTLWTQTAGESGYTYETTDLLAYSDGGFLFNGVVFGGLPGGWTGAPYIFKADSLGQLPCSERVHSLEVMDLFPMDSSFTLTSVEAPPCFPPS